MPIRQFAPLTPALVLLLGAASLSIVGPPLTPRHRHRLVVAISALAVLSLFFTGQAVWPVPTGATGEGLGEPTFALRVARFEPYLWILMVSLLAISLAERETVDRISPLDQAMLFALTAAACGVVLADNYLTLASSILLFDTVAALFALATRQPGRAVGRLLLGALSSAAVMVLAQNADHSAVGSGELGGIFSLTVWLRLGLYPLAESDAPGDSPLPVHLGWTVVNLAVGLYLVSAGTLSWLVWLAAATMVLHGALAWLEPSLERGLVHATYALAGGILTMMAAGAGPGLVAAAISMLAALVALELTLTVLGRSEPARPWVLWVYLPALLATASLIGVPLTLGWEGRGALYHATWEAGALGTLALVVVAEGAALSALYRFWLCLLRDAPWKAEQTASTMSSQDAPSSLKQGSTLQRASDIWYLAGAATAGIPFLLPVLGPGLVTAASTSAGGLIGLSPLVGLVGSLLWALFLGYGRHRLLDTAGVSRRGLMHSLRLGWLLRSLGYGMDRLGRALLRVRAVIEGEHYLAWAILLALGLALVILLR